MKRQFDHSAKFCVLLDSLFIWGYTKEGVNYWRNIWECVADESSKPRYYFGSRTYDDRVRVFTKKYSGFIENL